MVPCKTLDVSQIGIVDTQDSAAVIIGWEDEPIENNLVLSITFDLIGIADHDHTKNCVG